MPRNLLGPSAPDVKTQTTFGLQIVMIDDEDNAVQVGTATNATPSHQRSNTKVGGVGIGDRIMEIVPGLTSYTLSLTKFSLWNKYIYQVLGYNVNIRMLAEMQTPFDVYTYHLNPTGTTSKGIFVNSGEVADSNIVTTIYRDCVVSSWNRTQQYDADVTISDVVEMDVTRIEGSPQSLADLPELW